MAPTAWWYSPVGGEGGTPFQHVRAHDPVSKMEIWTRGDYPPLVGMRFTHVSGTQSPLVGKAKGTLKSFTIAYGERLIRITQYAGQYDSICLCVGFTVVTDKGRSFTAGSVTSDSHSLPPCGGFVVGMIGRAWDQFDQFSLCLLDNLQRCDIDMNYLMLPQGGISAVPVANVVKNNLEGKRDANIYIAESISITSSVTTSKTWGESLGIPVSVSGKVFGIGIDSSTDYTYREERSQSTSYSVTKTTDISASMQVPPRKKYLNTALYYKGTFDVEFRPKYALITRTGFKAIFPDGPAQPVFGVASGNIVITTADITNMSRSELSQLTSRQTEIVAPPDDKRKDTALVKSTPEAGLGNVLTREVLDDSKYARISGQLIGMPADGE